MGAAALPYISGVGVLGGLLQGRSANKAAKQQLGLQQRAAQGQQQLFQQTAPTYTDIIQALRGISGLNGPQGGGAGQLPYTNVTPGQLGIYGNTTDALRLRAAEDQTRQNLTGALHNFSFGAGQRGLYGSSIDASGRDALIADALRGQNAFSRQLAIQAPETAMNRLSTLAGLLGPGLGAGPVAAGLFGQGGQTALGQANLFGQQAANSISNYLQYANMRNLLRVNQQPPPAVPSPAVDPYALDLGGNF